MLAIVAGCERYDQYNFGRKMQIETDHKPLVTITQKPIHSTPKRLQRMLLQLQRYDVEPKYKRGKEMHIVDALSRAYVKNSIPNSEPQSEFCHQIEDVNFAEHLPISGETLQ